MFFQFPKKLCKFAVIGGETNKMEAIEWTVQLRLAVAIVLGLLVGLERESSKSLQNKSIFGGIRTYPIISMFGFGCAWLFSIGETIILPVGLIAVCTLVAISYFSKIKSEKLGMTSEVAALLTFVVGALALLVDIWAAMALGIINTMLLSEKARLEDYVEKLDRVEFLAVLKFLLVTIIILPVLPNKEYTEFGLNPSKIWQIVILVSTIGFVGYILTKRLGNKVGFWVSGFVGGIVSSTAVSIAYGRLAQKDKSISGNALQGSLVASSVMYLRVLVLIFIINPVIAANVFWKLLLISFVGFAISLIKIHYKGNKTPSKDEAEKLQNPFEIRPAILFAVLFVALTIITRLITQNYGNAGVVTLAGIVGIVDVDPFILSLIGTTTIDTSIISAAMIIAMMSNTLMKGIYFGYFVSSHRKDVAVRYGILTLAHIPLIIISLL